jgi:hypothetical protein
LFNLPALLDGETRMLEYWNVGVLGNRDMGDNGKMEYWNNGK